MIEMDRRDFIRMTGAGAGLLLASGLFEDRLRAGEVQRSAAALFESRFGVSRAEMARLLRAALSRGGDFADLYLEYQLQDYVVMEDDIIKESSEQIALGVGIRVLAGKQTGYAHTSELTPKAMRETALTAASIAASGVAVRPAAIRVQKLGRQAYAMEHPVAQAKLSAKSALVQEAYAAALAHDKRITKVVVSLTDELQYVTMVSSEGPLVSDTRPQVRLTVRATAEDKGVRNTGSHNVGGRVGMAFFRGADRTPKEVGIRAAEEAITLLSAVNATPGDQPVVLGKNQSGVMIHEAVGHPLEADGNWRKTSIMHDKMGTMVASPLVTIYDDATLAELRGSLNVDDEGTLTERVLLIDQGKLVGYLHDRLSARVLGAKQNGHGRRQSYRVPPIPRMNNTVLAPGESAPEDIIRSVKKGFYADTYQGGMVQGTGKFTFSVNLGYLIEDGKLTRPVKNATLIGTNVQILREVELIGNDLAFFLGTCGKAGQTAPVTAGTPTLKIRQMTVGGRA